MFTFAHVSDLHLPPLPAVPARTLASKRLLGYLSWHSKRKADHRAEVLEALRTDLLAQAPQHICVTGDLTNLALPAEFAAAAAWLSDLGDPAKVSVVPGNHDAYVAVAPRHGLDLWAPWMRGDDGVAAFPYVRRRGGIAFIGVSSAVPTAPFLATGRVGPAQCARLHDLLTRLGRERLFRVVLIHHPPGAGVAPVRHRLSDAGAVAHVLAAAGAELVLHGHIHRPLQGTLAGGEARAIPVLGAASGSAVGHGRRGAAHYHLLSVTADGNARRLDVAHRRFDPARGYFVAGGGETIDAASPPTRGSAAAEAP